MKVFFFVTICVTAFAACSHPPKPGRTGMEPFPIIEEEQKGIDNPKIAEEEYPVDSTTIMENANGLNPVFFDYDKADIRADQISVLQANALYMQNTSARRIQIQGHCDERGTEEYNLALGDRRARAVRDYLTALGISDVRLSTISYGEAEPLETEHNELAWSKNRRAQFLTEQP